MPVDGPSNQTSSYHTKLFGILGALLMLNRLLQTEYRQWRRLTAVLWYDNEAAVNRFNTLEGCKKFSIAGAKQCNANMLHELRCVKAQLPINIQACWVKPHQENFLTREARMNRVVDRLAATQHDKTGNWALRASSVMLPQTAVQLHLPKGRYTSQINGRIQYDLWKDSAEDYIDGKLKLYESNRLVDWEALGCHHQSLPWQQRATRLKMIFRWAPTNARKFVTHQLDIPMYDV